MTEKEITMEDLEESAKQTDEQLDLMAWKMDDEKGLVVPVTSQDMCVMNLLKSVSELPADKKSILAHCITMKFLNIDNVDSRTTMPYLFIAGYGIVRSDYRALRRELGEVQQLQRELSARLRAQLRLVHGKFARLRQRLADADKHLSHQRSPCRA